MEPTQIVGVAEESHSSESGWTMYIGSFIDDDGHSDDRDHDDRNDEGTQVDPPADESDDSMASDASSGPSHYENPWRDIEVGHGSSDFKQAEEIYRNEYCLDKRGKSTKEKQPAEKKLEKKESIVFNDDKGKAPVQGVGKVRKNHWVGQRK